jgi:XrtN system VIT domain protein
MEAIKKIDSKDQLIFTGLIFIILSFLTFMIPEFTSPHTLGDTALGGFFVHYLLAAVYSIIVLVKGGLKFRWRLFKNDIEPTLLILILFMISAFALNRALPVFEESTGWVCAYLITQCVVLILLIYGAQLPSFFRILLYFLLGSGLILYAYFCVYLVPLYAIGVVGSFLFGISVHVFTPLFFLIFSILFFRKIYIENKRSLYPFLAGIIAPIVVSVIFISQWQQLKTKAERIINEGIINESALPIWAKLSQHLPKNALAEKLLKTDLVYSAPDENASWGWRIPQQSFDEIRKHDPLVMTAVFLKGKLNLSTDEKINVLESMYDSRHQAQDRLWSGDRLETSNVISNIKLFPEYRMAYTEKIISICNTANPRMWRTQQEAIYTFHLPEGGVVTSLSLWIKGKEEKAILTTKAKATEAYTKIVGVESRDPSVVHWQEGNTVTVRVFPCTPDENRRFKIGVTAPLRKKADRVIYENIYFDGPSGKNATETVKMQFTQKPDELDAPTSFSSSSPNTFSSERTYEPYWEAGFKAPAISGNTFSFDGCSYKMENYEKQYEHFQPNTFYLDINSSWSKTDFNEVWERLKDKDVYVYQNELIQLNEENKGQLFIELSELNFSLFPLNKIRMSASPLLITKSTLLCPNLKDLAGSDFSKNLTPYLKSHKKLRVFNIGDTLSPYLKTLKELRMFLYDQGTIEELSDLLAKNRYIASPENDSTIAIDNAAILIKEVNEPTTTQAPDHLLRLFTYNHVMKEVSENYFNEQFINDNVVSEAQKAYIVSPVSSLIVLETQADYDRFDIKDNQNSLKNASMKSSGAVPEPHEWLLIIIAIAVALYLYTSSTFKQKSI